MGRSKDLSQSDKEVIVHLAAENWTHVKIALKINRPRSTVTSFLNNRALRKTRKSCGRKKALSQRTKRRISSLAVKNKLSSRKIHQLTNLTVSHSTIYRALRSNKNIKYGKLKRETKLTERHIKARMMWAKKYQTFSTEWKNVLFSDEKKWNLDGPDGYYSFWQDKRSNSVMSQVPNCRHSIMVWGCFSSNKKLDLHIINDKMDSQKYQSILEKRIKPLFMSRNTSNLLFQSDNAPVHVSCSTNKWLSNNGINCIDWPPVSPDLNPIENLWGILSQRIYGNGTVFTCKSDLEKAIRREWAKIAPSTLSSLSESMKDRVFDLIKCNGKRIKY